MNKTGHIVMFIVIYLSINKINAINALTVVFTYQLSVTVGRPDRQAVAVGVAGLCWAGPD